MSSAEWATAIERIRPYIFKVETPDGAGSGFGLFVTDEWVGIATAYHVIGYAHEWGSQIRLTHHDSGEVRLRGPGEWAISVRPDQDLALLWLPREGIPIPSSSLRTIEFGHYYKQGIQLGWCGFPQISPDHLCFFTGHVSAYLEERAFYLVDGNAISGVSGGPAFHAVEDVMEICGVVTAYIPHRDRDEVRPGVCTIQSVGAFFEMLPEDEEGSSDDDDES